ncbi:hypothetical protein SALBM217S_09635 [Streptomyces griseoloalbus]
MALVLGIGVLALRRSDLKAYAPRFLAQFGSPLLVLAPWSLSLLPFGFFTEAGLPYGPSGASPLDLLGASPGGPWPARAAGLLLIGLVLAALAALLRAERRTAILTAWAAALVGLVFAVLSNNSAWAGPATLVQGIALLAAGTLGADGARARVAEQSFGWRQPVAALIALACAVGPLVLAVGWMVRGADGPVERRLPVQVPAFVAEESATRDQARTLVLDTDSADRVDYVLVRGSGARMGDAEIAAQDGENDLLDKVVANLVAGSGADQADQLGGFAVRYVLVHRGRPPRGHPGAGRHARPEPAQPAGRRRAVAGGPAGRPRHLFVPAEGKGEPEPVAAGPVEIHTVVGAAVQALDDETGGDWLPASADPSGSLVLPGIPKDAKAVRLVAFTLRDADVDLKVQLASPSGLITPAGNETLHLKGGMTAGFDLGDLTRGEAGSLVLTAPDGSVPVVAAVRVLRGEEGNRSRRSSRRPGRSRRGRRRWTTPPRAPPSR